ncbi:MAG: type II toxin-antitoxin system RelE/ParE family toxin [Nitrospinae bacterium]|jgi:toxin ParE1/3/4|nr:type II toxin-antitoxin system RelE/ParE family toxin [Nitrospinota bacterium]MDA1110537.1 type II toxin-antitoxin system RelE/ParE family toxin [Nitrospinota bacterium]
MPDYELSQKADQDLTEIYQYSIETFGEGQADKYFLDLDHCLQTLAENPHQGRPADEIEKGIFRYEHGRHIVFYVVRPPGIFVARILHQSMDIRRHFGPA